MIDENFVKLRKVSVKVEISRQTVVMTIAIHFIKQHKRLFSILIACCLTIQEIETRLFLWYKTLSAL
jgi:hypothetical protein